MFFRQAITVRCANVFVSGHFKPILYLCVSPYVREPLRLLSAQGRVARPWQRWELRQTAEDSCIETCVEQTGGIRFARCWNRPHGHHYATHFYTSQNNAKPTGKKNGSGQQTSALVVIFYPSSAPCDSRRFCELCNQTN